MATIPEKTVHRSIKRTGGQGRHFFLVMASRSVRMPGKAR